MGNCSKQNPNKITTNTYLPLYQQLLLKIYTEENASPQQLKPLLEYLESNQIRVSDIVLIVQNQIAKADYPLRITVSLDILYGVMGLINQSLINLLEFRDEEKVIQNDSRAPINSEVSYAYQNKQRLQISMNNIIKSLQKIFMEKQCFLKEIFFNATRLITLLVESNELFPYGDYIIQTIDSVIIWYLLLYALKNYPEIVEFQEIIRNLTDSHYQSTAESVENFESLFNLHLSILKFELKFSDSSQLFLNKNQQLIFELILWIYTLSSNTQYQIWASELMTIYKQRALMYNKSFQIFKICVLNFKQAIWSDIQKAEKLFYLTMINDDNKFQISALNIITDQIIDFKTLLMNINTQDYPATRINQLQPIQFKKYLDFSQSFLNDCSRSSSQTIQKQKSQKYTKKLLCLQSVCRCLQLLVEDMRSVEFLFYQSELIFIRLLDFYVYTIKYFGLSNQIIKTLETFIQRFSKNPETSIRVIQIIIQKVYDQIQEPNLSEQNNLQVNENITDELQYKNTIDYNYTNALLELSFQCLEMTDFNNQVIEDELIYLLLKIQLSYETRQEVFKILQYLLLSTTLNYSLKQSVNSKFKSNAIAIAIFFKKTLEQSLNSNFFDNNQIHLIIQVSHSLITHNELDLVFSFLRYLQSLIRSQQLQFIQATILLGMIEKLQLYSKQLIIQFLGVPQFLHIKIFHLNDAFNFKNKFYLEHHSRILEECNLNLSMIEQIIKPEIINFNELDLYVQKTQSIDAVSSLMPSVRSPEMNQKSRSSLTEQFEVQQYPTLNSVKSGFDEILQKFQKIRNYENQIYLQSDPLDSLVG